MFWKVFLLIVTLQSFFAYVYAENEDDTSGLIIDRTIQSEMYAIMSSSLQALWKITPSPEHNIQLFPLIKTTSSNMVQMMLLHRYSRLPVQKIGKPYSFADTLDKMANSSNVKFKLTNAIFYDQRHIDEQYLEDLLKYYHSEAHGMFFDSSNAKSITYSLNEWYFKNSNGRQHRRENLLVPGMNSYHAKVLYLYGCWDTPKIGKNFNVLSVRHHRRALKKYSNKFAVGNATHYYLETLNATETIGYFNNSKLEYEAIRIPYTNGEFAMVVVLPYENRSLELVANFTNEDYTQLFESVNVNHELIDYAIPLMSLSLISVNQNGTVLNGDEKDLINCNWSSEQSHGKGTIKQRYYKRFHVSRPFGVLIYHEQTKYVLWQALVRNPTTESYEYVSAKFINHVGGKGEINERRQIP